MAKLGLFRLKPGRGAPIRIAMDAAERKEILSRYRDHSRRFEAAAARRGTSRSGAVIPFNPPVLRELAQEPTAREIEVLQLVAEGRSNGEIGSALFISTKTASVHVSNILAKLGVSGRGEAAAVAHRVGLTAS